MSIAHVCPCPKIVPITQHQTHPYLCKLMATFSWIINFCGEKNQMISAELGCVGRKFTQPNPLTTLFSKGFTLHAHQIIKTHQQPFKKFLSILYWGNKKVHICKYITLLLQWEVHRKYCNICQFTFFGTRNYPWQSSDDLDLQIKIVIGRSLFDLIADHFLPFF